MCFLSELDTGEQLLLSNISREQTGVYRCTAINGVTPSASWDIKVEIECELQRLLKNNLRYNLLKEATIKSTNFKKSQDRGTWNMIPVL